MLILLCGELPLKRLLLTKIYQKLPWYSSDYFGVQYNHAVYIVKYLVMLINYISIFFDILPHRGVQLIEFEYHASSRQ